MERGIDIAAPHATAESLNAAETAAGHDEQALIRIFILVHVKDCLIHEECLQIVPCLTRAGLIVIAIRVGFRLVQIRPPGIHTAVVNAGHLISEPLLCVWIGKIHKPCRLPAPKRKHQWGAVRTLGQHFILFQQLKISAGLKHIRFDNCDGFEPAAVEFFHERWPVREIFITPPQVAHAVRTAEPVKIEDQCVSRNFPAPKIVHETAEIFFIDVSVL